MQRFLPGNAPYARNMTLAEFRVRYPEFKNAGDTLVQAVLDETEGELDTEVWASKWDTGHGLLTAHRLALSPFGQTARMVDAQRSTTYKKHFDEIVVQVSAGIRVL